MAFQNNCELLVKMLDNSLNYQMSMMEQFMDIQRQTQQLKYKQQQMIDQLRLNIDGLKDNIASAKKNIEMKSKLLENNDNKSDPSKQDNNELVNRDNDVKNNADINGKNDNGSGTDIPLPAFPSFPHLPMNFKMDIISSDDRKKSPVKSERNIERKRNIGSNERDIKKEIKMIEIEDSDSDVVKRYVFIVYESN